MYRPTIKSNLWLGLMALVFIGLYYWSENSLIRVRPNDYSVRIKAAEYMKDGLETLIRHRFPEIDQAGQIADSMLIYHTMLGDKDSPITTDEGRIDDKITVLNPNFAAAVVDMFSEAGLKKGDTAAVLVTGAMPGANIAVFAAAKAMGLDLVVTTSVGSSWWGANSPGFTWLDMERVLKEDGVFSYSSAGASAGGSDDNGGIRLSEVGRELIAEAIDRNGVTVISEGSLSENIVARKTIYERYKPLDQYDAVVNVGGGIAAIGHGMNDKWISSGVHKRLPLIYYPNRGVVHLFSDSGVPIVFIADAIEIAERYKLPIAHLQLPAIGIGKLYEHLQYDPSIAWISLILMFVILGLVKYFDIKRYKWREEKFKQDAID